MAETITLAKASIVRGLENPAEIMMFLETVGRICHASGESKGPESAEKFVKMLIRLGHESVLEHVSITVMVECDRAMAQQWTRHRLAAYTMESQRYVTYKGVKFIDPEFRAGDNGKHYAIGDTSMPDEVRALYTAFEGSCHLVEGEYHRLLEDGAPPEDARAILPNCTKTILYTTANLRAWRHIFAMRCAAGAQHNIRRVMIDLLKQFHNALPAVFHDLFEKYVDK